MSERDMIRQYGEVIPDLYNATALDRCLKGDQQILAVKIFKYVLENDSYNDNHREIIMKSLNSLLKCDSTKSYLSQFFILKSKDSL